FHEGDITGQGRPVDAEDLGQARQGPFLLHRQGDKRAEAGAGEAAAGHDALVELRHHARRPLQVDQRARFCDLQTRLAVCAHRAPPPLSVSTRKRKSRGKCDGVKNNYGLAGSAFQTLMSSKKPSLPPTPSSILDFVGWPMPEDLR